MLPGDIDETKIDEGGDTRSFSGRGVGSASPALRVVDVEVGRSDIEITGNERAGAGRICSVELGPEPFEPHQLVEVVRVAEFSTVGDVNRPDTNVATGGGEKARFVERWCLRPVKPWRNTVEPDPTRNCDTVPVVNPVMGDVIARCGKRLEWEVGVPTLCLLQQQDINVVGDSPCEGLVDPGSDRIDVPGCDPHGARP